MSTEAQKQLLSADLKEADPTVFDIIRKVRKIGDCDHGGIV